MKTSVVWRSGQATDTGRQRSNNEDRVYTDETRGIFLVADGVGGYAAGEKAAEIAVDVIPRELDPGAGEVEDQVRRAITLANNRIHAQAQSHPEWNRMACVLTLAIAHDEFLTVGHVGDSRLYLVWNGTIRKLTPDHSPVGELEDQGELTESQAMLDPRRNEVFRDVGSQPHKERDPDFIEVRTLPFHPAAALVLCSDGLSDVVPSATISAIVEQYSGDPAVVAQALVDAANEMGGTDNISVIFVPGPEFVGVQSPAMTEARSRHAVTRMRSPRSRGRQILNRMVWLGAGVLLGMLLWAAVQRIVPQPTPPAAKATQGADGQGAGGVPGQNQAHGTNGGVPGT